MKTFRVEDGVLFCGIVHWSGRRSERRKGERSAPSVQRCSRPACPFWTHWRRCFHWIPAITFSCDRVGRQTTASIRRLNMNILSSTIKLVLTPSDPSSQ
jgi:hypothetical protein